MERNASALSKATGAVIRGRYKKIPITQEQLATATGLKLATVQRLIAGKAEFDMDQLWAIADALGTTPTSLLKEAEDDLASSRMSVGGNTPVDIDTKRKQNEARTMTIEQIEDLPHAATRDPEMDTDEPD